MEHYVNLLNEFLELFEEMILVEKEKRDVVIAHDLLRLEDLMKKEQAGIMKIRGMEQRRIRMQNDLGFGDKTFQVLLQEVSDEERLRLTPIFRKLEDAIRRFRVTNESTSQVIETALHDLNTKFGQEDAAAPITLSSRTV